MGLLIAGALLWLGVHVGIAGTQARAAMVRLFGEARFKGGFALLALAALAVLLLGYGRADTHLVWVAPAWFVAVVDVAMLPVFVLLACALIAPRGILPVTRHPMMAAIGLWAGMHLLAAGDSASILLFGTFLATVLIGLPSADAKRARREPDAAAALFAVTSRLPFGAILGGRNRLTLAEIGWIAPLAGLVVWVAALVLHPWVIGVSPLPVW
jgi:uncharacterized membrane protein